MSFKGNQKFVLAASLVVAAFVVSCVFITRKSPIVVNVPQSERQGQSRFVVEMPPLAITNVINCGSVVSAGNSTQESLSVVVDKLLAHDNEIRQAERERKLQHQAAIDAKVKKDHELRQAEMAIREEQEKKDAMKALFLINHVNWVVTKIKSYNDPAVLEELYNSVSQDAILLDQIKDEEIADLFCDIMYVITQMRIDAKERDFLRDELDQGMSDALFDAFSGVGVGGGLSPVGMAINLLTSAATAGINYKRAKSKLMSKFKKQEWALDKERMIHLNDLNMSLFKKYWLVIQRRGIPDPFRVTESDITRLIERMKSENAGRRHRFLVSEESTYRALPIYWHYRGQAAYEIKDAEDARASLDNFQEIQNRYGKILRRDPTAVSVALLRVRLYIDEGVYDDRLREQLGIIEQNYDKSDWQKMYVCAAVYAEYLDDYENAKRVLTPVIDMLEDDKNSRLVCWQKLVEEVRDQESKKAVGKPSATGDALFSCKSLLVRAAAKSLSTEKANQILADICNDDNASAREKLFCYGAMNFRKALEALAPDLSRIRLKREGANVRIYLPLSWIRSREGLVTMHFGANAVPWDCNFAKGWKNVSECGERTIVSEDDGDKVVMSFNGCGTGTKFAALSFLYDVGGDKQKEYYYVVLEFDAVSESMIAPFRAQIGRWAKGGLDANGKPVLGHWVKDEDGKDISEVVSLNN